MSGGRGQKQEHRKPFAKDREGRFLAANAATARAMGLLRPADVIGHTDADFLAVEVAARYQAGDQKVLAGVEPLLEEEPAPQAGGDPARRLLTLKAALKAADGRIVGLVGHSRDVTEERRRAAALAEAHARLERQAEEMRRLAEAAERASRAKSDFLSAMSHEIRTPMTGVLGMAELLALEGLSPRQQGHVEAIRTSGQHLLSIINDVLDFSRIEAGRLDLERIDFAVPEILDRVRSILSPQATEHGLELRFSPLPHLPLVVQGDPTRLTQLLINLVGNGIKFTARGGVKVSTHGTRLSEEHLRLRFEVQDTGIGIPKAQQADLFQAFVQADGTITRRFGGSGLGLAICKKLVEAMGGTIGIESETGLGSLFWFEVTLKRGDAAALTRKTVSEQAPLRSLRIMVVEDVPLNRELMRQMLGRRGHEVICADNGAEAVVLSRQAPFDVILMDVQMPVMDGIEATRRIRQQPPLGTVPIIALTANVMANEQARCLSAGMSRVLTKPVVWPDLFAVLATLTDGAARFHSRPPGAPG